MEMHGGKTTTLSDKHPARGYTKNREEHAGS
jgi:hypothetical protein